jgi:hypothetical protein
VSTEPDGIQTFLDSFCEIKPSTHTGLAFRIGEGKPLRGEHYKTPWREAERPTPLDPRRDLTVDEAMEAAMQGRGLLVLGAPGTGKTHWVRGVVAALRQAGKRVDCIAKTHVAVHNLAVEGACTADHWVRKHVRAGGVHCQTLVIEELTQINVQLWADLALCRMKGVAIIACGDFGQFGPVCESWAGCEVEEGALEHSAMLLEMCPNRLVLTKNRRSDERIFVFYTQLGDLDAALVRAKEQFPRTDRPADYTLTMSHARRMAINRQRNEDELASKCSNFAVFIQAPPATRAGNQPQDMWVWPGLQLIGAGARCLKGLFYEVAEVDEESVQLQVCIKSSHEQPEDPARIRNCQSGLRLTHEHTSKSLRLAWAITYASCQGLTLRGVVRLETQSPNFTLRHLYVGISRATAAGLAEVV